MTDKEFDEVFQASQDAYIHELEHTLDLYRNYTAKLKEQVLNYIDTVRDLREQVEELNTILQAS